MNFRCYVILLCIVLSPLLAHFGLDLALQWKKNNLWLYFWSCGSSVPLNMAIISNHRDVCDKDLLKNEGFSEFKTLIN